MALKFISTPLFFKYMHDKELKKPNGISTDIT